MLKYLVSCAVALAPVCDADAGVRVIRFYPRVRHTTTVHTVRVVSAPQPVSSTVTINCPPGKRLVVYRHRAVCR